MLAKRTFVLFFVVGLGSLEEATMTIDEELLLETSADSSLVVKPTFFLALGLGSVSCWVITPSIAEAPLG